MLYAYDPDRLHEIRAKINAANPDVSPQQIESLFKIQHTKILDEAAVVFTGELNVFIENVRKAHEQFIDDLNRDTLVNVGWDKDLAGKAAGVITDFNEWLQLHKNEILALQIFYNQPQRRREITYKMIRDLVEQLKLDKPLLAPLQCRRAGFRPPSIMKSPTRIAGSILFPTCAEKWIRGWC